MFTLFFLSSETSQSRDHPVLFWKLYVCALPLPHKSTGQQKKKYIKLRTPRPTTRVPRALRARSVPGSVPENGGVRQSVPQGVSGALCQWAPGLRSVQKVSRECPQGLGHLFDTPGTRSGHFWDTPEAGARRALEAPRQTLPRTPPFSRTLVARAIRNQGAQT